MSDTGCPCGSANPYAICCGPCHRGERNAPTAEALMRSRYCAYALGDGAYLLRTLHPDFRQPDELARIEASFGDTRWQQLVILNLVGGQTGDSTGMVEFVACYKNRGNDGRLHERSQFVQENGQWFYTRGEIIPAIPPGRNDPCWCGSGKKFKKCHG